MSELTIIITIIFIFSFVPLILAEISRVKSRIFLYAIAPYQHSYTFSQYTLPGTLLLP